MIQYYLFQKDGNKSSLKVNRFWTDPGLEQHFITSCNSQGAMKTGQRQQRRERGREREHLWIAAFSTSNRRPNTAPQWRVMRPAFQQIALLFSPSSALFLAPFWWGLRAGGAILSISAAVCCPRYSSSGMADTQWKLFSDLVTITEQARCLGWNRSGVLQRLLQNRAPEVPLRLSLNIPQNNNNKKIIK